MGADDHTELIGYKYPGSWERIGRWYKRNYRPDLEGDLEIAGMIGLSQLKRLIHRDLECYLCAKTLEACYDPNAEIKSILGIPTASKPQEKHFARLRRFLNITDDREPEVWYGWSS
ncbi:hypothetical protein FRB90_010740 [Tulasnella sp. 427]|nr:hypothetical protein FRB90_010740 [Tulasnella sp. 427]